MDNSHLPPYAVISTDTRAFFLGRYMTRERALKAIGNNTEAWAIYILEDKPEDV